MADTDMRKLAMHPQGLAGRLFSRLMERGNERAYRRVQQLLGERPCTSVLEIGFGTGRMLELLAQDGCSRLAGVDPTPDMVVRARSRLAHHGDRAEIDLRCITADVLDWPDGSFDAVLALHSFQFWPRPDAVVADIRRLLTSNGRLFLVLRDHSSGAPEWLPNPLSRSGNEVGAAIEMLHACPFDDVREAEPVGDSRVLVASRR